MAPIGVALAVLVGVAVSFNAPLTTDRATEQAASKVAIEAPTAAVEQATLGPQSLATTAAVPAVPPGDDVDVVTRDEVLSELSVLLADSNKDL